MSFAICDCSQFSSMVKMVLRMSASGKVTSNSSNVIPGWKLRHTHGKENKAH
jgi:hypothetical protein